MKRISIITIFIMGLFFNISACSNTDSEIETNPETSGEPIDLKNKKLSILVGDTELVATLYDNVTTQDFVSRLPLTIRMIDIGSKEKYAGLSSGLKQEDEVIYNNAPGQLVYWPTGSAIAIYYKTDGQPVRGGIIVMGQIDKNTEILEKSGSGDITFKLININE